MRIFAFILLPLSAAALAQVPAAPVAPVREVTDAYFGTTVRDPYRYFENVKDPEAAAWIKGQGAHARAVLDAIPGRAELQKEIARYGDSSAARIGQVTQSGDHVYYQKRTPPETQFKLYVRTGWKGAERLLVDPDAFRTPGATHMAIDLFRTVVRQPVRRGRAVAGRLRGVGAARDRGRDGQGYRHGVAARAVRRRLDRGWPRAYNRLRPLPTGAAKTEKYLDSTAYSTPWARIRNWTSRCSAGKRPPGSA